MTIKYYNTAHETGLTLKANLYNSQGVIVQANIPLSEVNGVFISGEIQPPSVGVYVVRIIDSQGNFLGHGEIAWDGIREIDLNTVNQKLWTEVEKMQIRDAQGIDGDKMVARNGQLQKKSEYPYNKTIDSKTITK